MPKYKSIVTTFRELIDDSDELLRDNRRSHWLREAIGCSHWLRKAIGCSHWLRSHWLRSHWLRRSSQGTCFPKKELDTNWNNKETCAQWNICMIQYIYTIHVMGYRLSLIAYRCLMSHVCKRVFGSTYLLVILYTLQSKCDVNLAHVLVIDAWYLSTTGSTSTPYT